MPIAGAQVGRQLISCDPIPSEMEVRTAAFVGRILRGTKPAEVHVGQPTKFELKINVRTAKALGVTVPQALGSDSRSGTTYLA